MISIDYREEKFLVTALVDQDHFEDINLVGVLKRFETPVEAIKYALGVMDGIQIYTKSGYFKATEFEDVRLTPEAAVEITEGVKKLISCPIKEKIIVCYADKCSFNNGEGGCDRNGEYVSIAVYDKSAQCCNYQAKGLSLIKTNTEGSENHEN